MSAPAFAALCTGICTGIRTSAFGTAKHSTAQHSTAQHDMAREQQMKVAFFMSLLQCLHLPCAANITVQACCMHSTDSNLCPFIVHHIKQMSLAEDQPAHATHLLYGTTPTRCNIWATTLCFSCLSRGLLEERLGPVFTSTRYALILSSSTVSNSKMSNPKICSQTAEFQPGAATH